MTISGHVINGVVVPDGAAALPEGAAVQIIVAPSEAQPNGPIDSAASSLFERMKSLAGAAKGLPSDLALNHDHYLHGQPKRP